MGGGGQIQSDAPLFPTEFTADYYSEIKERSGFMASAIKPHEKKNLINESRNFYFVKVV